MMERDHVLCLFIVSSRVVTAPDHVGGPLIVKLNSSQATDRPEGQIEQVSRLIWKGRPRNMFPVRSPYLLLERVRTTLDVACPECLCVCEE